MKKIFILLLMLSAIVANAQKRWIKMGSKNIYIDSTYHQKPVQIGDSVDNPVWIDSICVDDSGDTLLIATSQGIFKAIKNPGSGGFSGDYEDLTNLPSIPDSVPVYETDPVYVVSVASGITGVDTANWNNNTGGIPVENDTIGVVEDVDLVIGTNSINTGQSEAVPKVISIQDTSNRELINEVLVTGYTLSTTWSINIYTSTAYDSLTIFYIKDDAGLNPGGSTGNSTLGSISSISLTGGQTDTIDIGITGDVPTIISIKNTSYFELSESLLIIGYVLDDTWKAYIYSSEALNDLTIYYIR